MITCTYTPLLWPTRAYPLYLHRHTCKTPSRPRVMICIWHCFECEMGLFQQDRRRVLRLPISHDKQCHMHFLTRFPMFCALLNVFIISFFTRVRDGYILDLVSKWGVCFGVREYTVSVCSINRQTVGTYYTVSVYSINRQPVDTCWRHTLHCVCLQYEPSNN